ncbi:MAG: GDSL-type esterase/lipase family protein [Chthoniobacterales bacterium]
MLSRVTFFLFAAGVLLQAADPPAATPRPREQEWCKNHHKALNHKAQRGGFDVMLLGDSITWEWDVSGRKESEENGLRVWPELAELRPATFGVPGDRTEHLLWRLLNGNLQTPEVPKTIVLMIGTNNTGQRKDSPEDIASGVRAILEVIRTRFPLANVLLYGIFPRGKSPEAADRKNNTAANKLLEQLADGGKVRYVNLDPEFLNEDGSLNEARFRDGLHLSESGYRIWAESLKREISATQQIAREK